MGSQGFTPVMMTRIKKEKREIAVATMLVFDALALQVAQDPDMLLYSFPEYTRYFRLISAWLY
jgi:hypothetical protein